MSYADFREYINNGDYCLPLECLVSKLIDNEGAVKNKYRVNSVTNTAYAFTNENLKDFFKRLNLVGKKVMTVGSSGDQAINSSYYGAKEVTIVDANFYAKPFTQLKIAAIKNFTFDDFDYFFRLENISDHRMYSRLSHDLDEESRMFWDMIFLETNCDDYLFGAMIKEFDMLYHKKSSEFYVNEACFNKAKEAIKQTKFNFVNAEFSDFPFVVDGKFDLIMLSNIFDYVVDKSEFSKVVKQLYRNNLNEDGAIQVDYSFVGATDKLKTLKTILYGLDYKEITDLRVITPKAIKENKNETILDNFIHTDNPKVFCDRNNTVKEKISFDVHHHIILE